MCHCWNFGHYWCPQCNKCFRKESAVVNHMGQPWPDCITSWMHNLDCLSSSLQQLSTIQSSTPPSPWAVPNFYSQDFDIPMDDTQLLADCEEYRQESSINTTWHTDTYPGAACTYGPGVTFMGKFDNNKHSIGEHTIFIILSHHNQICNSDHG